MCIATNHQLFAYPYYHLYQTADRNGWWVMNQTTQRPITHKVMDMNCSTAPRCPERSVGYWQFAEPGLQAAWVAACTDPASAVDGCFIDGACSAPPYGAAGDLEAYEAGRTRAIGVSNYCDACLRCLEVRP